MAKMAARQVKKRTHTQTDIYIYIYKMYILGTQMGPIVLIGIMALFWELDLQK